MSLLTDNPDYAQGYDEEPGEGAELLDEVHAALTRYVAFAAPEHADAVTVWTAATHAQSAWEHAARLVLKSPVRQCGKTRCLEIVAELAYRVLRTTNISVAALVRSINEDDPPTLMLDEADAVFATRRGERSEGAEDIRGILNSGHARGWPYIRWDATTRGLEHCPTFGMAALGGIGDLPDTIEDRGVIVGMRRRAPGETVRPYRVRRDRPELHALRDRLHTWVRGRVDALTVAEPALPVEDRPADVWEPLVAIADAAGGTWPARIRAACVAMTGAGDPGDASAGERLLADLREVFGDADSRYTATILERLCALEESPWAQWSTRRSDPRLNARDLAGLLRPYGIRRRNVREGGTGDVNKGYSRADLADAWQRYVPRQAPGGYIGYTATSGTSAQVNPVAADVAHDAPTSATSAAAEHVADDVADDSPPIGYRGDQQQQPDVADVADVADGRLEGDYGPCARCRSGRAKLYGADASPLCPDCREATP